jgi:quinol-cytochrome oxidoreductase complex cytochrome b subunit
LRKNNDPSDDAITHEDKGYVILILNTNQLISRFFSVSQNKVVDEYTIFTENQIRNFPTFMWLFIGILCFCLIGLIIYVVFYIKNKNEQEFESNESLIKEESLLVD